MKNNVLVSRSVRPFVKWAGGKNALLNVLIENLPSEIEKGQINRYVEPFVGGGALFFRVKHLFPSLREFILCDTNSDLMLAYRIVRDNVHSLIKVLSGVQSNFFSVGDKKSFYLSMRERYNNEEINDVERAALFIFLNKTCFNGLYRVNSRGKFNVPFGRYKNPRICDSDNLINVSEFLEDVKLIPGDFGKVARYADSKTFIYLDPPYRPISKTAKFTSYQIKNFDEEEQRRLVLFFKKLHKKGAKLMLSNSFSEDGFFQSLYSNFNIKVVEVPRFISARSSGRGKVREILITNYGGRNERYLQ